MRKRKVREDAVCTLLRPTVMNVLIPANKNYKWLGFVIVSRPKMRPPPAKSSTA